MAKIHTAVKTDISRAKSWPSIPTTKTELKKRLLVDRAICGWIGGNYNNPALCSADSVCVRDIIHKYVGCCEASGPCTAGIYTSCIDQSHISWSPPKNVQTNGVYTCSLNSQCYRNVYADGFSQYGCGKSDWATSVETTYTGQPSDIALQLLFTTVTFSAIHATSTPIPTLSIPMASSYPSSSNFLVNTTTAPASSASTPTYSFHPTPTNISENMTEKGPSAGTLAGIVIGSINGALILAGLAFCLCLHKKKQQRRARYDANTDLRANPIQNQVKDSVLVKMPTLSPLRCFSPLQNMLPSSMRFSESPPAYQYPNVAVPAPYTLPRTQSPLEHQYSPIVEHAKQTADYQPSICETISSRPKDFQPAISNKSGIGVAVSSEQTSLLGREAEPSPPFSDNLMNASSILGSASSPPLPRYHNFGITGPTSFLDDDDSMSDGSEVDLSQFGQGLGSRYQPINRNNRDEP